MGSRLPLSVLFLPLLSEFLLFTSAFIPNQRRKYLSFTGSSRTHKDIIECAHRDAAKLYMNDYRDIFPDQAKAMATKEFKKAKKTFREGVAKPDLDKTMASDPLFHFDEEEITTSNKNIVDMRKNVMVKIGNEDWTGARDESGMLLHTLQDFYSHSNWIEMGKGGIHTALATNGYLGPLAAKTAKTCDNCAIKRTGTCVGNIAPAITAGQLLTTGYAQIWPPIILLPLSWGPANKKPAGKCSHGGAFDITAEYPAYGGINKDANSDWLSPHHYLHPTAAALAKAATVEFFKGVRKSSNDEDYAKYLGLEIGSSLCFVVDTTGSMSHEIAAVRAATVRITQDAAGSTQKPSDYILVPFNDPGFGPLTKTKDSAAMIAALNGLTATGGGDFPEMFFSGLNLALNNVRPGSTCFAFTDASAKDAHLLPTTLALITSKDITVFIFLTNGFKRRRRVVTKSRQKRDFADDYRQLALLSGGQVIDTTDTDIDEAVKVVDVGISPIQVTIVQKDGVTLTTGTPNDELVHVDETLSDLVISVTTTGVMDSVQLLDPSGSIVTPGAPGSGENAIEVINVGTVKLCTVASPDQGVWKVRLSGGGLYNIRVTAKSLVDFSYTFVEDSDIGHGGYKAIDGKPLSDEEAIISIQTYDEGAPVSGLAAVNALLLVALNGDELQRLDVFELIALKDYVVNTTLPTAAFRVMLEGVDKSGNVLQRLDSSLVTTASVSLDVILEAGTTFWLLPGETIEIKVSVHNAGTSSATYTLSVIDTENYFVSVVPSSLSLAGNTSETVVVTFTAPASAVFGDFSTASVTAASGTGDENFVVFRLNIGTATEDETPPECTITHTTGDCSDTASGATPCEDDNWSIEFSAQDAGLGLHSIRPAEVNPDATFTVGDFDSGSTDAVTGGYASDCCVPRVEVVASDVKGNTGSCVVDYIPEDNAAGKCTVSDTGELNHQDTFSQLSNNLKSVVAETSGPDTDPCKVKIQIRMDQNKVTFAAINIGLWPGKPAKYRKNYVFNLWGSPGLSERGYQVSGVVTHTSAPAPWTDGQAGVTITQFTATSWKLEATCNGAKILTLYYGVPGSSFFDLNVTQPGDWSGLCYA